MWFSSQKSKWRLIIFALLIAVACFVKPAGNRLSTMQIRQIQSSTQLKGISQLVLGYENEHEGNKPRSLIELVPDDQTDLLHEFYASNDPKSPKPVDRLTNKAVLDEYSDYVLPLHSNSNIVAFEKSGLWPDGSVAVCFTNLSVKRMSASDFKALVSDDHNQ